MSDYISREAAQKAFENTDADVCESYPDGACDWGFGMKNIQEVIDGIPAADVEPVVHGRWISLTDCSNAGVYCSICHKKVYKEDYAWCNRKNKVRSPYCPNCGSKMDLEDDNGT